MSAHISEISDQRISVDRPVYNKCSLKEAYTFNEDYILEDDAFIQNTKRYLIKNIRVNGNCMKNFLFDLFPIIKWLPRYDIRKDVFKDLIAGLTVGVIQIAPTMANSQMANLPPINGLYVAFFAVMTYFFMGTCRHLSLGTHGVISLMIGKIIEKYQGVLYAGPSSMLLHKNRTKENEYLMIINDTSTFISSNPDEAKVMIATSLCFLTGIIHMLMSILNGGVFTKYFSNNVLNSFTISSSIIIVVSQIETLLGISIKDENIPFELIDNLIGIGKQIHKTNVGTLIVSVISIVILYCVKKFINEKFKKKLVFPVPIELIVVIFATLFSYSFKFKETFQIKVVGTIPLGMPSPKFPPIGLVFMTLVGDAFNIAIVSFALNISLVKYFSHKHDYEINSNQELLAYGVGNLACSFFAGFPACSGLTRSLIVEGVGARTHGYSLISSLIVLAAFVGIGFLFKELPNACLAAIIVVSLIHKCLEVKSVIGIFKKSKIEACAWFATFFGVLVLDIDYGLYIGLACSLLLIIFQTQRPPASILGNLKHTEFYEEVNYCPQAVEIKSIKIIRYEANIYYANVENFIYQVIKLSQVKPREVVELIERKKEQSEKIIKKIKAKNIRNIPKKKNINDIEMNASTVDYVEVAGAVLNVEGRLDEEAQEKKNLEVELEAILGQIAIKDIILDLSCINFIDSMGAEAILRLAQLFRKIGIQIHLTHIKGKIFKDLKRYLFMEKFDYKFIYPSNQDAVSYLTRTEINQSEISIINGITAPNAIAIELKQTDN